MGQTRFLTAVHAKVREAVQAGHILDAYSLADALMAADRSFVITRQQAVNTVLAAGVVYGASLLLDPGRRPANDPAPRHSVETQQQRDLRAIHDAFA